MMSATPVRACPPHRWERYLQIVSGVECVIRSCRHCGRQELCWSRQPLRQHFPRYAETAAPPAPAPAVTLSGPGAP
jgi:hypothetical protein